jgi:hypothetical protein
MKKTALLILFLLNFFGGTFDLGAGASNKSGNPFGNGSFFKTTGTFNGVLRGQNIVGVTVFTTGTNTTLTGGPLYIYNANTGLYDDTLNVYAILNPNANTLDATIFPFTNTAASNNLSYGGGSFSGSLTVNPPNQTFSGTGNLTEYLEDPPTANKDNLPFVINGCRIGD